MRRETALLQLIQARGLGNRSLDRLLARIGGEGRSVEDFVTATAEEMIREYDIKPDIASSIKSTEERATRIAEQMENSSVEIVVKGSSEYPTEVIAALGNAAPAVLFIKGDIGILKRRAVGFCGSRKASERGVAVSAMCSEILAANDVNVVSGYAHGVDMAAHEAALKAGGATTLVLAEGILNFRPKKAISEYLADTNYLVVSEFLPRLTWAARNAMHRNRTICALSNAMIVIESGLSGGTFAAGNDAIELGKPLFVVDYAQPAESAAGNRYFLDRGAKAIRGNREGVPNLRAILSAIRNGSVGNNGQDTVKVTLPQESLFAR